MATFTITDATATEIAAIKAILEPKAAQVTTEVSVDKAQAKAEATAKFKAEREANRPLNKALAATLRAEGLPANGAVWKAAKAGADIAALQAIHAEQQAAKVEGTEVKAEVKVETKRTKSAKKSAAAKKAAASKPRVNGRFVKASEVKAEVVAEAPVEDDAAAQRKADLALLVSEGWPVADALELLNA